MYYKIKHHKISKLLNESTVWKSVTRKLIEVNDLLNGQYSVSKYIKFETPMLRSNFCNYSDAYIAVKGTVTAENINDVNKATKNLTIKN